MRSSSSVRRSRGSRRLPALLSGCECWAYAELQLAWGPAVWFNRDSPRTLRRTSRSRCLAALRTIAEPMLSPERLSRRNFLGLGLAAAAGALLPSRAVEAAAAAVSTAPDRTLSFFHTHTSEQLTTAYCCEGEY